MGTFLCGTKVKTRGIEAMAFVKFQASHCGHEYKFHWRIYEITWRIVLLNHSCQLSSNNNPQQTMKSAY